MALGMLLDAEWSQHLQVFVKVTRLPADESDGWVFPAPIFSFFDRKGVEVEGKAKEDLQKLVRHTVPFQRTPPSSARNVFSPNLTATSIANKMHKANTIMDAVVERESNRIKEDMNNHILDALRYGFAPRDAIKIIHPPVSSFNLFKDID